MLINSIKSMVSVIFPLITFPYISRVLQVENVGKYNFANSIISYFILLAGLGFSTYAIREGAKIRNNQSDIDRFSSEIFTFNILSTFFSYVILLLIIVFGSSLHKYAILLIVLSLQILSQTIGREWINAIYEDYIYLAIRYILFQFLSLILLFIFVKKPDDYINYALIVVVSNSGSSFINYFHTRKFCNVKLVLTKKIFRHAKPALIFFATTIAITIYVSSDTTLLGLFCGDYSVGIYSMSVKIYSIIKTVFAAAISVTIPRLSILSVNRQNDELLHKTLENIYNSILSICFPSIIGIIVLAPNIILLLSDYSYIESVASLRLLSIALIFCQIGYFWGQCVLYPFGKERIVLRGTIVSAIINVLLNVVLIPLWKQNAAAMTTIIAEGVSALIFAISARKYVLFKPNIKLYLKIFVGSSCIPLVNYFIVKISVNNLYHILLTIIGSIILYFLIEIILKNEIVLELIKIIIIKIMKK